MLQIDPNELANRFRQPGGSDWAELVDNVLWAACWQIGIPESAVRTCLRTDIADGGVDTRISEGSGLDMTGYLGSPSIWQFKGSAEANLRISEVANEVNKPHAKKRILAGDAYRLCLCVQFTDEKRTEWEDALESAVASINGAAPMPKILTVDDVARMAGHFPNFIHEFSGPIIHSTTSTFSTWGKSAEARTRKFVPGASFTDLRERIRLHVELAIVPADPVLTVRGLAGTGKTRLVYEALRTLHASHSLTTYAQNGQDALKAARILANTPRMGGILVADDCSLQTREEIAQAVAGHEGRIRVVVIQDDLEEDIAPESELRTPRYTHQEVANLLAANFGEVSPERVRAYVTLTDGYLRFAIDLCARNHEIQKTQGMVPAMPTIMAFYRNRLGSDTAYLDALGLFTRVGWEGDVSGELDALCTWRGFRRSDFEERCVKLRDSPGFVERSAIYYRVSPDIIASQAFAAAWKRWANGREQAFLTEIQTLPQAMQKSFMTRVARSATTAEVRNAVRDFFQSFASKLTSADLSDIKKVLQLITLTEVEPDYYFPVLRRLVESTSDKQLSVDRPVALGWGPRRQLVFAAERMAHFSSFFDDAERILFRLSQVEIEPNIGNNASGVWDRLFRPKLSGTPIPFARRVALLRRRLPRPEEPLPKAIEDALEKTFDYLGSGRISTPVVGGRITEPQWTIRSQAEQIECINLCLVLLFDVAQSRSRSADSSKTFRLLIDAADMFVRQGFLEVVKETVHMEMLPDHVQADLYSRLTKYATRSGLYRGFPENLLSDEYAAKVAAWVVIFAPRSLLSRVVQESNSSFFGAEDEQQWLQRMSPVANEFLTQYTSDSGEFGEAADWLHAAGAHGAFNFGFQVGRLDLSGLLLDYVFERAVASEQTEFARGYLAGSHAVDALAASKLSELLNRIEMDHPKIAYSLAHAVAELSDVFGRTLDMVKNRRLEPSHLRDFTVWIGTRKASLDDVRRALKVLMPRVVLQEPGCADIALEFVAYQYYRAGDPDWVIPQDDGFHMLSWQVVDAVTHDKNLHGHWWGQIVLALQKTFDPLRTAKFLVKTMCCENFHLRQEADRMLGSFAESHPQAVMDALGEMMLDEEMQVHFHVERFSTFLTLPPEVLDRWLEANGVEGALRVAHHIPGPYLDDNKVATLHPLTRMFLERHAEDDRVFHEFAGSLHSLQSYKGDIAALKEEEAELARRFLKDDSHRVRDWATYEIETTTKQASEFRAMIDKHRD